MTRKQNADSTSRLSDKSFLALAAKKSRNFILRQNWFSDPIEIENFFLNFDTSIEGIATKVANLDFSLGSIVRVDAPKKIEVGTRGRGSRKIINKNFISRPLAHLDFRLQVISTAILMMTGDFWEDIFDKQSEDVSLVIGNRLNRKEDGEGLVFSIGSNDLYRFWGEDYAHFVKSTADRYNAALSRLNNSQKVVLLSTDISNFYPSVDLELLSKSLCSTPKLTKLEKKQIVLFFESLARLMKVEGLKGLPQGMVASGFFANISLHKLDQKALTIFESDSGCSLKFFSRYVDDIRMIVVMPKSEDQSIRKIKNDVVFRQAAALYQRHGFKLLEAKSNIIEADKDGERLIEGQLAEHMEILSTKSYGALNPEEAFDLARELKLLFRIDSNVERKPQSGLVTGKESSPLIDGPGVRQDSRKRFSAGRWSRLFWTYRDVVPNLEIQKKVFIDEIFRDWKSDPSQIRLLFHVLNLSEFSEDILKQVFYFLDKGVKNKSDDGFIQWREFILSSVFRMFIDRKISYPNPPSIVFTKALDLLSKDNNGPWFLRLVIWVFLTRYKFPSEMKNNLKSFARLELDVRVRAAIDIWQYVHLSSVGKPFDMFSVCKNIGVNDEILKSILISHLNNIKDYDRSVEILRENYFLLDVDDFSKIDGIENKNAIKKLKLVASPRVVRTRQSLKITTKKTLADLIAIKTFVQELNALTALNKIVEILMQKSIDEVDGLSLKGQLNPFNIVSDEDNFYLKEIKDRISVDGWRSINWKSINWERSDKNLHLWSWPLGLMLRAMLSGRTYHLNGSKASSRYSLFLDFKNLCQQGAFVSEKTAEVVFRLLRWPGSKVHGFSSLEELSTSISSLIESQRQLVDGGIQMLPLAKNSQSDFVRIVVCQFWHGLDLRTSSVESNPKFRSALLYALSETKRQIKVNTEFLEEGADGDIPTIVVLPEISVPKKGISDVHRFARDTGAIVLFGRFFWIDSNKNLRNSMYWVFPGTDNRSRNGSYSLRQDKIFPNEEEQSLQVKPADPPIIWRIDLGDLKRVCGLNCYELTSATIKRLLSGAVEATVVSAHNKDVDTFDDEVKALSLATYGYTALANTGQYGGSFMYAPFRGKEKKTLLHSHGNARFVIGSKIIDLKKFRQPIQKPNDPNREVKYPPAGFKKKR